MSATSPKSAATAVPSGRWPARGRRWTTPLPTAACIPEGETARLLPGLLFASFPSGQSPAGQGPAVPVRATRQAVVTKQMIYCKGDPGTHVYVVTKGRVKVTVPSEDGKELTLGILESGEVFGVLAALEGKEHAATVIAMEHTELAAIEREEFLRLLEREPAIARALLATLCARLRQTAELAQDISSLPLPRRLAKKLLALSRTYGTQTPNGLRIGLHLCQQELADLVGTSRESVNKQLGAWQAGGLIGVDRGLITIRRLTDAAVQLCAQRTAG